jgi:hypothetical protein
VCVFVCVCECVCACACVRVRVCVCVCVREPASVIYATFHDVCLARVDLFQCPQHETHIERAHKLRVRANKERARGREAVGHQRTR